MIYMDKPWPWSHWTTMIYRGRLKFLWKYPPSAVVALQLVVKNFWLPLYKKSTHNSIKLHCICFAKVNAEEPAKALLEQAKRAIKTAGLKCLAMISAPVPNRVSQYSSPYSVTNQKSNIRILEALQKTSEKNQTRVQYESNLDPKASEHDFTPRNRRSENQGNLVKDLILSFHHKCMRGEPNTISYPKSLLREKRHPVKNPPEA